MNIQKLLVATFIVAPSCLVAMSAQADQNAWLLRARGLMVAPTLGSSTIPTLGGKITAVSHETIPEFDISYFVTPNISAELILGTSRHRVIAQHGAIDLGKVSLLPPTLTLQYHFMRSQAIQPYVGAGINYTAFYHVNKGPNPAVQSLSYSNSFGPALQIGVDMPIDKNWSINFDVKKLYVKTTAHVGTALGTLNTDVTLNPVVYGLGIGYRFS